MDSRKRVRTALSHKTSDRVPASFNASETQMGIIKKAYGFADDEQVLEKFEIDTRFVEPKYIGPELKSFYQDGMSVKENIFGVYEKNYWNGMDYNLVTCLNPLENLETIQEIENYPWPQTDWFDYDSIKYQCEKYKNKAIIAGTFGVFQIATKLKGDSNLYIDMAINHDYASKIFEKINEFEIAHYEKILQAADGQIDILRCFDDFGTQNSLLFSIEMWREYFHDNLKRMTALAHKYNAYFMTHSCGAVRPVIPELIECGVDVLDPIQQVVGMEPEGLKNDFGNKISFHGGIDTQQLLPHGTVKEIMEETRHYIEILGDHGGYILAPSQAFMPDVPVESIEAMYKSRF